MNYMFKFFYIIRICQLVPCTLWHHWTPTALQACFSRHCITRNHEKSSCYHLLLGEPANGAALSNNTVYSLSSDLIRSAPIWDIYFLESVLLIATSVNNHLPCQDTYSEARQFTSARLIRFKNITSWYKEADKRFILFYLLIFFMEDGVRVNKMPVGLDHDKHLSHQSVTGLSREALTVLLFSILCDESLHGLDTKPSPPQSKMISSGIQVLPRSHFSFFYLLYLMWILNSTSFKE